MSAVAVVYGRSVSESMFRRRTSTGSSPSARAIASIVPSVTQLQISIGARYGPDGHLFVSTAVIA